MAPWRSSTSGGSASSQPPARRPRRSFPAMAFPTCPATTRRSMRCHAHEEMTIVALSERKMSSHRDAILQVRALRKSFGATEVLKGIDLTVAPQELVFIIGPSGSGKSTFLRCLNRLEEPTDGSIFIDGVDLLHPKTDINAMRRRIGMVFQAFNLYPHMTALGNVTLALRKVLGRSAAEAEAIALAALARVGLKEKARAYPNQLSGGQQQRVAIARAIALEPRIMLFDEPTSSLDPELAGSVLAVMRDLGASGMTMVVASHEIRFARDAAHRVVFMEDGLIVDQGPPERIFGADASPRARAFVAEITR